MQGGELEVRINDLRDINGLLIPSHAVHVSADMMLTFCTPHKQPPECDLILMIYTEGLFSASLPRLTHEGSHYITINHGDILGCSSNATLVASCKADYTANERLECVLAEDELVCRCWPSICLPLSAAVAAI